jgi:hypothetical protein
MSGRTSDEHDQLSAQQSRPWPGIPAGLNEKVSTMLLNPEDYIPIEVALRTTQSRQAYRAQPRRTKRRRVWRRNRRYTLAA